MAGFVAGVRAVVVLVLLLSAVVGGAVGPAEAQDTWSTPFPGVRHLHRRTSNQELDALVVDLCASGVSLRGTADGERRRTVPAFGSLVGAQAAINGDFFSYADYSTNGPTAHGGASWGGGDHDYVAPLAFGDHRVELRRHEDTSGLASWMREVVSGHPTILVDGVLRESSDPLCTARHPRTAVGLSADRRTLVLAVIDGRATSRIGMTCAEEAALLRELGASEGLNLDGGGSSTMWLGGSVLNHPSDGSPRVVGNHLALFATGSGPAAHCPDLPPEGWIDAAACDGVRGWARDPDVESAIDVHLYFDGGPGEAGAVGYPITAGVMRTDVGGHGFSFPVPHGFMDGADHTVRAYGIGAAGGVNAELSGSPATLRCDRPSSPFARGVRRHVTSPTSFAAWHFDGHDVVVLSDAELDGYGDGADWPEAPELVQAEGDPGVYLRDGEARRHVPSPDAMAMWHLAWSAIESIPLAELDALTPHTAISARPFLVRGSGAAIYVVDALPPEPDAGLVTADAGATTTGRDAGRARDAGASRAEARPGLSAGCHAGRTGGRSSFFGLVLLLAVARGASGHSKWRPRTRHGGASEATTGRCASSPASRS